MSRYLVLCLSLTLAACANHGSGIHGGGNSNDNSSHPPDAATVCKNSIAVPMNGVPITQDQLFGKRVIWTLTSAQAYERVTNTSGQFAYLGYTVDATASPAKFTKICGGSSGGQSMTFRANAPEVFRGDDRVIQSMFHVEATGNPSAEVTATFQTENGNSKKADFSKGNFQIQRYGSDKVQVLLDMPADTGTGEFVMLYTYVQSAQSPETTLDLYQKAYDYAYNQMSQNSKDAQSFAAKVSEKGVQVGGEYLDVYGRAYSYLNNQANESQVDSMKYADAISSAAVPTKALGLFEKAYTLAYNNMNMSQADAIKFALQQAGLKVD
jgi:hypothetical protein